LAWISAARSRYDLLYIWRKTFPWGGL